ncbi:ABC transporter ATP-binding protein [Marinigracilibium pacificum]|uniref:ATP-binding cassette domain-containing protein n=1 Tax=Marinigracilibium pacificum TaxID=2729599 RepID=A0A848J4C9_9BACT|nr:ABC transporter transmembrane domain-containing protein [Marinigracilibium pacificum]NMM50355.1 ATP-binding cassette domain-containing protein [Marinigracilibium pacificum]
MKTFTRLFQYAKPIGWLTPIYIVSTLFFTVFSLFNLLSLVPIMEVLFDQIDADKLAALKQKPVWGEVGMIDYYKSLFYYNLTGYIQNVGKLRALQYICTLLVGSVFFSNLFRYISQLCVERMKVNVIRNFRTAIFDSVTGLHVGFFTNEHKGDIMSRITSDVQEVENSMMNSVKVFFKEPILIIVYFVTLFGISAKLTLYSLILLPVSGVIISAISKALKKQAIGTQTTLGKMANILEESLSGMRVIKAFNARDYINSKFEKEVNNYAGYNWKFSKRYNLAGPSSEFMGVSVVAIIILIGGTLILDGDNALEASAFFGFLAVFSQILNPAKSFTNAISSMQRGIVSADRIFELMDTENEVKNDPIAKNIESFKEGIEYKNVSFAYEKEKVINDISFTLGKGKTVALVGPSGGGKSTLADLLPRFYDPTQGNITLDGINLKDIDIESLRAQMGIVTQESILFNDTVFNNIAFGMKNVNEEDVIAAAKIANAHEFIDKLEEGYHSNIGERGTKLSGGQRQRISIARAILKNPPILILDEATSALDAESEKLVQEALTNLMKNRTSLVIAHRLSTIKHADEILVIERGQIIERGNHESLVEQDGLYAKLIQMQSLHM